MAGAKSRDAIMDAGAALHRLLGAIVEPTRHPPGDVKRLLGGDRLRPHPEGVDRRALVATGMKTGQGVSHPLSVTDVSHLVSERRIGTEMTRHRGADAALPLLTLARLRHRPEDPGRSLGVARRHRVTRGRTHGRAPGLGHRPSPRPDGADVTPLPLGVGKTLPRQGVGEMWTMWPIRHQPKDEERAHYAARSVKSESRTMTNRSYEKAGVSKRQESSKVR